MELINDIWYTYTYVKWFLRSVTASQSKTAKKEGKFQLTLSFLNYYKKIPQTQ